MPSLSSTTILQQTLTAFRTLFPFIQNMGTDFSERPLVKNEQKIAHISTLPTAASFDATTGYANGATEASSLLVDVPITPDQHNHVPLKVSHLNAISERKNALDQGIVNAGYVMGKTMVDSITAKLKGSNLSYSETASTENSDLDVVEGITTTLNGNGAMPMGRIGLVSSAVAQTLAMDTRIASRDYYGQLTGSSGLRAFRNVGGFEAIFEYPGLDTNNAVSQTFSAATTDICTAAAHGYETGDLVRVSSATTLPAGLSAATTYYVIKLSADTFSLATTDALATAGTAINITDTGTGVHSVVGYENVTGIFGSLQTAIAILAGLPEQTGDIAAQYGIPQVMLSEILSDPINGFALQMMKWQQAGTGNLFLAPTAVWGSAVGRQAGAAGSITDKGAVLLRSA